MKFTRRETLILAATAGIAAGAGWTPAFAADGDQLDVAALMQPDGIPDKILGNPDAKVTLIEYASPTCPHCARFSNDVLPAFEAQYVDTGKVRYIMRPFMRNLPDAAIFLLAEAAAVATQKAGEASTDSSAASSEAPPADGGGFSQAAVKAYQNVIATYFKTQDSWVSSQTPYDAIFAVAQQLGFTKETFEAALNNKEGVDLLNRMQQQAMNAFGLQGTPTFYLNGKQMTGEKSLDDLKAMIDPLLT